MCSSTRVSPSGPDRWRYTRPLRSNGLAFGPDGKLSLGLGDGGSANDYGWDVYEGTKETDRGDRGDLNNTGSLTEPVAQYDHDAGCSITGGVVVRNARLPALDGRYVYGDYCSGMIWSIPAADGQRQPRLEPLTVERLVSVDAATDGTVYVTSNQEPCSASPPPTDPPS